MLWTAFTIGIFGSLHCVGMCGPIAMALPQDGTGTWRVAWKVLLYNAGRVVTYMLAGTLIGVLGEGLFLAGLQRWISVAIGIGILLVVLFSIPVESRLLRASFIGRGYVYLKSGLARLLGRKSAFSFFQTGMLNGLLPCGLVYMAIAGAVTTGSVSGGTLYMLLFGLGTVPLMMLTALAGQVAGLKLRNKIKKLYPVFMVSLALLFIWRGLQFTVPSDFSFWEAMQTMPMCH